MNKLSIIATGVLTTTLIGCGGAGGGSSSSGIKINDELKGPETQPDLTTVDSNELTVNSRRVGSGNDSFETWTFRNPSGGHYIVNVTSASGDVNPSITNYDARANLGTSTDRTMVFSSGVNSVTSFMDLVDAGDSYEFILTSLNRETAKLTGNEYLVFLDTEYEEDCESYYDYETYSAYLVINWDEGYLKDGWEETPFTDVTGNAVTIEYLDSETYLNGTAEFTVDPENGSVEGTDVWSYSDDSDNCTYTETLSGQIIL